MNCSFLVHFFYSEGGVNRPKSDFKRERFVGESIANSLGIDYRYLRGSVPKRISTEKVNFRSLGSDI